jgi:hypothetical protein
VHQEQDRGTDSHLVEMALEFADNDMQEDQEDQEERSLVVHILGDEWHQV